MKSFILILHLSFLFLFLSSCSSSKIKDDVSKPVILQYSVALMHSGGFTGATEGHIIDTTGDLYSFKRTMLSDPLKIKIGKLSNDQLSEINNHFNSIMNIKYNMNGNMTTTISLSREKEKYSFSFKGMEPDSSVPDTLIQFYKLINYSINNPKGLVK